MEKDKINTYLLANARYFTPEAITIIRSRLENVNEDQLVLLQSANLIDPILALIVSIFFGLFGIDRFIIGDIGMGILKLCTFGGCSILAIVDLFLIMDKCKQKNFEKISAFL